MNKANVILFTFIKSNALDIILNKILAYSPQTLYVISDLPRNDKDVAYQNEVRRIVNSFSHKINIVLYFYFFDF